MKLGSVLGWTVGTGAGLLAYGSLVETQRLELTRTTLHLPRWPESLRGFRIGLIADLHLRPGRTVDLCRRAINMLIAEDPDVVVIAGDFVEGWDDRSLDLLWEGLYDLDHFRGRLIAVPGNHDYHQGRAEWLGAIIEPLGGRFLVNQACSIGGVSWVGIDSGNEGNPRPYSTLEKADWSQPTVVIWHEPDFVDTLPEGPDLMLSGHSHGGQFITPWGWAPMTSRNGRKYLQGFFASPPVPLYVTRGVSTTFLPSRLFCLPEAAILTLE